MKIKTTFILSALLCAVISINAQIIDVKGVGVHNDSLATLYFSDLGNIDHVVVEAVYKAYLTPPNGPVIFSDNDESYNADANPVEFVRTNIGNDYDQNPSYFRATFNTVGPEGITLDQQFNFGGMHSFIAYVYRNDDNPEYISYADFDHVFMFKNGEANAFDYVIPIDPADNPRDVKVKVAVSEIAYDDRICVINVSDGNQVIQQILVEPNLGNALNIAPFDLTNVAGDVTEITVSIYSPPYTPQSRGDSFITGGVVLDVEQEQLNCDECSECDGGMTALSLQYLGDESNATIKVYKDKVKPNKLLASFDNVNQGDTLSFVGVGNDLKLGAKIRLTINDDDNNYIEIHTSCSQPINVGMLYEETYLIIAGTSKDGGPLCDIECLPDCGECDGQMTALSLEYLGDVSNATIKVYKDKIQPDKLLASFDNVNQGDTLSFIGTGKDNKMGAKIRLTINDDNDNYTEIHTSCSQPIYVGMTYDDLYLIIAGTSKDGGPLCEGEPGGGGDCGECDGQMTALSLEYLGDVSNATIKVYKDKVQSDKLLASFDNVNQGDTLSFIGTGKDNKMGAKIRLTINDDNDNYIEIHTSCSQPIGVGMIYENTWLIIAGTSKDGGPLCDDNNKSGTVFFEPLSTPSASLVVYPNPLKTGATIDFSAAENGNLRIELINLQGKVVKQIYNGNAETGYTYSVLLNASDLNGGIYMLRMVNGAEIVNKKLLIVK